MHQWSSGLECAQLKQLRVVEQNRKQTSTFQQTNFCAQTLFLQQLSISPIGFLCRKLRFASGFARPLNSGSLWDEKARGRLFLDALLGVGTLDHQRSRVQEIASIDLWVEKPTIPKPQVFELTIGIEPTLLFDPRSTAITQPSSFGPSYAPLSHSAPIRIRCPTTRCGISLTFMRRIRLLMRIKSNRYALCLMIG